MCLAIPSKVISINKETNMATLDTLGVQREASLDLMQDNEEDAIESLKLYAEMIAAMQEEDEERLMLEEANRL